MHLVINSQVKATSITVVFLFFLFFLFIWVFFHELSQITGLQGKGESISLTPHYHFHPLHRHLDISRAITAESSPLHIASSRTRTGNLWFSERKPLTTKRLLKAVMVKLKQLQKARQNVKIGRNNLTLSIKDCAKRMEQKYTLTDEGMVENYHVFTKQIKLSPPEP